MSHCKSFFTPHSLSVDTIQCIIPNPCLALFSSSSIRLPNIRNFCKQFLNRPIVLSHGFISEHIFRFCPKQWKQRKHDIFIRWIESAFNLIQNIRNESRALDEKAVQPLFNLHRTGSFISCWPNYYSWLLECHLHRSCLRRESDNQMICCPIIQQRLHVMTPPSSHSRKHVSWLLEGVMVEFKQL